MTRIHIALNTNKLQESLHFYSKLFDTAPAKVRHDWVKFDLAEPALNLTLNLTDQPAQGSQISHLGVEVDNAEVVQAMDRRLQEAGLVTAPEEDVTCCYARQDKTWVTDPNGHAWEFFYVKDDAAESGADTAARHAPTGCC